MAHRSLICAIELGVNGDPNFTSPLREMEEKLMRAIHDSKMEILKVFSEPLLAEAGQPSRFVSYLEGRLAELNA